MKRLSSLIVIAALAVLAGCASHSTELNGTLSANTRNADEFTASARRTTTTARKHRRSTTTTTRRSRRTTTTSHTPTTPTVPETTLPPTATTISQSGVAGAVVTETCTDDRPCSMEPGQQATVALLDSKGDVVTSTHTRDNGTFVLQAQPGSYTLAAKPPTKKQVCDSQPVTVTEGHYTSALISCHAK